MFHVSGSRSADARRDQVLDATQRLTRMGVDGGEAMALMAEVVAKAENRGSNLAHREHYMGVPGLTLLNLFDEGVLQDAVKRKRGPLSYRQAGEASGLPYVTIHRLEKGVMPEFHTLGKILKWLRSV